MWYVYDRYSGDRYSGIDRFSGTKTSDDDAILLTANDFFSGNYRYSGTKNPDRFFHYNGRCLYCQALRMSKEIDQLPNCREDTNARCFQESYEITQEHLRNFSGPCTKLDYKVETRADSLSSSNEARFQVYFDPPRVAVSEEYLIFDLVAMVSAIGGTLGLCIGFSFADVISSALKFIERFAVKLRQEKQ